MDRAITQLFVNGQAMVDARRPNTTVDHLVDAPAALADFGCTPAALIEADLPDGDWTGAYVNAVAGFAWVGYTRRIESSDPSTRTATFDSPMQDPDDELPLKLEFGDSYFVFGSLEALDVPGEWHYDAVSGRLFPAAKSLVVSSDGMSLQEFFSVDPKALFEKMS